MMHPSTLLKSLALTVLLILNVHSTILAQTKIQGRPVRQKFTSPVMEFEPDMGDMMIISELWLSYESWRFGKIDRHTYFLIMQPHAEYKASPPWLIWVGPSKRLKRFLMQGKPEFSTDGTATFRTNRGVFIFPLAEKNLPATYNGRKIFMANMEFGLEIPLRKMKRPTLPDSCPRPVKNITE